MALRTYIIILLIGILLGMGLTYHIQELQKENFAENITATCMNTNETYMIFSGYVRAPKTVEKGQVIYVAIVEKGNCTLIYFDDTATIAYVRFVEGLK